WRLPRARAERHAQGGLGSGTGAPGHLPEGRRHARAHVARLRGGGHRVRAAEHPGAACVCGGNADRTRACGVRCSQPDAGDGRQEVPRMRRARHDPQGWLRHVHPVRSPGELRVSLVTPAHPRSPPQHGVPDEGWRLQRLLLAPHRLGFALAVLLLCASALWWAAVLLDRATGALGLPLAVSPSLGHAAVMTWGFLPLFFAGFLFTAGPKWLGVAAPSARSLFAPLVLQAAGWLVWLA